MGYLCSEMGEMGGEMYGGDGGAGYGGWGPVRRLGPAHQLRADSVDCERSERSDF